MDLLLVADGHYYRDKHGDVYVESVFDYQFYKRYLTIFDKVYAVARITHVDTVPAGKKKCSGESVEFLELPVYVGPWQYAKRYFQIKRQAKEICKRFSCAIFRLPGATANIMCKEYVKLKKPFAVEIVIDPWENFAPGNINSVLRPVIRYSWTNIVRKMCKKADGASYVTQEYLQSKYPSGAQLGMKGKFSGAYSSVELPDKLFSEPRHYAAKERWDIVHVANTFADYGKGHFPLMEALKKVRDKGYDVRVRFIGDGPKKQEFIQKAESLGISNAVEFLGRLPNGIAVKEKMAKADLFVFPTKAEGLPRGLLEAMSEGLPCISSPTCGIPEVLSAEYLYEYNDTDGFAEGIIRFISNPDLMTQQSKRNIEKALEFKSSLLIEKRNMFYEALKERAVEYEKSK